MKKLIITGATGSIGRSALDVVRRFPDSFSVSGLSAHSNQEELLKLGREFPQAALCLSGGHPAPSPAIRYSGSDGLLALIEETDAHMVLNGIAGSAGLMPSVQA